MNTFQPYPVQLTADVARDAADLMEAYRESAIAGAKAALALASAQQDERSIEHWSTVCALLASQPADISGR